MNLYTQYMPDDQDEETKRAMEALAGVDMPSDPLPDMQLQDIPTSDAPQYDLTPPEPQQQSMPQDDPLAEMGAAQARPAPMQMGAQSMPEPQQTKARGPSPWAVLADLALNKGKGIGQILAASGIDNQRDRELSQQYKQAQIEEMARRHTGYGQGIDPQVLAMRQQALNLRASGQAQQKAAMEARAARDARIQAGKGSDADVYRKFMETEGVDTSSIGEASIDVLKSLNPVLRKKWEMANGESIDQAAANKVEATTLAKGGAEHQLAPQHATDAAAEAVAKSAATLPYQERLKAAPGPAQTVDPVTGERPLTASQQLQREKSDALHSPIPGTFVQDPEAWKAATVTPAGRATAVKATRGFEMADDAIKKMIELREKHGTELYGETANEFESLRTQAITGYTEIGNSGVLNGTEYARYAHIIPGIGLHPDDALRMFGGEDVTLSKLKGLQTGTRSAIQSSLKPFGLGYGPAPKQQQSDVSRETPDAVDVLPVTDQKRGQVPKVNDVLGFDEDTLLKFGGRRLR